MGSFGLQEPAHYKYCVHKDLGFWIGHLPLPDVSFLVSLISRSGSLHSRRRPHLHLLRSSRARIQELVARCSVTGVREQAAQEPKSGDVGGVERGAVILRAAWVVRRAVGGGMRILFCILEEYDYVISVLQMS